MKRARNYASDLTDGQWQVIRQLLPKPARRGRKRIYRRWVIDAILYVTRTGCQWRMLPKNFPNWNTVYPSFRTSGFDFLGIFLVGSVAGVFDGGDNWAW